MNELEQKLDEVIVRKGERPIDRYMIIVPEVPSKDFVRYDRLTGLYCNLRTGETSYFLK